LLQKVNKGEGGRGEKWRGGVNVGTANELKKRKTTSELLKGDGQLRKKIVGNKGQFL